MLGTYPLATQVSPREQVAQRSFANGPATRSTAGFANHFKLRFEVMSAPVVDLQLGCPVVERKPVLVRHTQTLPFAWGGAATSSAAGEEAAGAAGKVAGLVEVCSSFSYCNNAIFNARAGIRQLCLWTKKAFSAAT